MTTKGVLDDPYAAGMLTITSRMVVRLLASPPLQRLTRSPFFAALSARIRFFDGELVQGLDAGIGQVVTLGAGYDARAWRFARAGTRFFEVDHPATQADKKRRAPTGGPTYVAVDFNAHDLVGALERAGFVWAKPAIFIVEGLTMYLSEAAVRDLLSTLSGRAAVGSRLAVNFAAPRGTGGGRDRLRQAVLRWLGSAGGEPHVFSLHLSETRALLAACGWDQVRAHGLRDVAPRVLGPTSLPIEAINDAAAVASAVKLARQT
jgi:methyltransferase (TIGR00027 family)